MSNPNNICNNPAFINMLDQKRRNALNNIPFPRYNNIDPSLNPYLQVNPSTGSRFTKFDLDMRRKAEILTYAGNSSDRFTNKLTKKELWSQLVKGTYQRRTYSQDFISQNTLPNGTVQLCPSGAIIYTPTTASDVPGPVINLYNDPNVPIYNLVNDVNSQAFAVLNTQIAVRPTFEFTTPNDIVSQRYVSNVLRFTTFTSLFLYKPTKPNSTFSVRTPISLQISNAMTVFPDESNQTDYPVYTDASAIFLSINNIYLNVLYSTSAVTFSTEPTLTVVTVPDINTQESYTTSYPMNISMDINVTTTSPQFSVYAYLGILNINNIILPTLPGFIYDIQLVMNYNLTKSTSYNLFFPGNKETINTLLNASYSPLYGTSTNCSFNPITVDSPYPELNVSIS